MVGHNLKPMYHSIRKMFRQAYYTFVSIIANLGEMHCIIIYIAEEMPSVFCANDNMVKPSCIHDIGQSVGRYAVFFVI